MIGSGKPLDESRLTTLWNKKPKNKKFTVTYESLKPYFSEYCWIGESSNDILGFFLYTIKEDMLTKSLPTGFEKFGKYAVFKINPKNHMDEAVKVNEDETKGTGWNYTLSLEIPGIPMLKDNLLIILYNWNHSKNAWFFRDPLNYYKVNFINKGPGIIDKIKGYFNNKKIQK